MEKEQYIPTPAEIKKGEEMADDVETQLKIEKFDEEVFGKIFKQQTQYPVEVMSLYDLKKQKQANPDARALVLKEGILPALQHDIWDHDNDLKSIENVIRFCYENNLYGKTLEFAIDLITSKKAINLDSEKRAADNVKFSEINHIIGHFHSDIYTTQRFDLAKKLNSYVANAMISANQLIMKTLGSCYSDSIMSLIKNTGKNPLPFKESGFDNPKLLDLIKEKKTWIDGLMTIKHFDETGELLAIEQMQEPTEVTEGIFVDIDGTLIIGEDQLNERVVNKLKEYKDNGKSITIFTAGNVSAQKQRLENLGLDKIIGEFIVRSKSEFTGKKLEITIDDFSGDQLKNIFGIFSENHIDA